MINRFKYSPDSILVRCIKSQILKDSANEIRCLVWTYDAIFSSNSSANDMMF